MTSACVSLEPFALRVLDDSMAPDLPAGAVVVVDPGEPPEDGCFVLVEHEGEVRLRRHRLAAGAPSPADEAGRIRSAAPAGPTDPVAGDGRGHAVRGVVIGVRLPRAKAAAGASARAWPERSDRPERSAGPVGRAAAAADRGGSCR